MTEPCLISIFLLESTLMAGLLFVGWALVRKRVNGPCRLCLSLLLAWRLSVIANLPFESARWEYVWGVLFGYAFLYATYHVAELVDELRSRTRRSVDSD